mgnify:CR=1 FL=1
MLSENLLVFEILILVIVLGSILGRLLIWYIEGKENRHTLWEMRLFRWLNGSRKNYHLSHGLIEIDSHRLDRNDGESWVVPTIEIVRRPSGLFGGIFGTRWYPQTWRIQKVWSGVAPKSPGDWVSLTDTQGLHVTDALRLVNTYPSLQAMLDRIAEIENQLSQANEHRQELNIGIQAVLNFINSDRQKFRSPTNQRVRELLEEVRRGEPEVDKDKVFSWAMEHVK